jgi:hypothetical protein
MTRELISKRTALRTIMSFAGVVCLAVAGFAQYAQFPEARNLIQRVQEDMRRSADFARQTPAIHKDRKQIERWDNAQRSMSDFDRHLSKGKYDKGELDGAINDLKNVVDHNTLASEDRDILNRDLADLRQFRADHS